MEVVEQSGGRDFFLSHTESFDEDDEESGHIVHGVALGHRDLTRSKTGETLFWSRDALQMAARSLEGRPLVVDHEDSSYAVVGEVMRAKFEQDVGIVYEARLTDEDLAEKIQDDLLEVSVKIYRPEDEELERREDGSLHVDRAEIDNLSIVPVGEAPSNYVEYGESENFSEEIVSEALEIEEEDEDSVEEELDEDDLRQAAAVVADRWNVSTGEAQAFINAMKPEEESDRQAIATIVAREYEGLDPVEVQQVLSHAEESEELVDSVPTAEDERREEDDRDDDTKLDEEKERSLLDEVVLT